MTKIIELSGNVVAIIGILICLLAGVVRLAGSHYLVGFETATLFTGGIALMLAGCLAMLYKLARH